MPRGRKARTWIDVYRDTEVTYAPNTIGAVGLVGISGMVFTDTPFVRVVEGLMNLQATHPPKGEIEAMLQIRLRYVCSDFLSRKFNINPPWPLVDEMGKPLKRSTLKYIKMLGAEATALFNLVSDVFAVRPIPGFTSAAEVWAAMMLEGVSGIIPQEAVDAGMIDGATKREAIDQYQKRTKALSDRECNPYPRGAHKSFFDIAMAIASQATGRQEDRFSIYARSYLPYLKARSELSAYIDTKKSKIKMLKNKSRRI